MLTTYLACALLPLLCPNDPNTAGATGAAEAADPWVLPAEAWAEPNLATATGHWYWSLRGALTSTEDSQGLDDDLSFDEGFGITLAFGHRFGELEARSLGFGLELEGLYTDQDADDDGELEASVDVTVLGAFINGVLDYQFTESFGIYGGAGIGIAGIDVGEEGDDLSDFDEEDGPFLAWQAKLGLRFKISSSLAIDAGYRFVNIDDVELEGGGVEDASFDLETTQHLVEAGLTWWP